MINDCITSGQVRHGYINTDRMCADVFTQFFSDRKSGEWVGARKNVNVFDTVLAEGGKHDAVKSEWVERVGKPGPGHVEALARGDKQKAPLPPSADEEDVAMPASYEHACWKQALGDSEAPCPQ